MLFLVVFAKEACEDTGIFRGEFFESDPEAYVPVLQVPLVNDVADGVDNMIPDPKGNIHFGVPGGNGLRDLQKNSPIRQIEGSSDDLQVNPALRILVSEGDKVQCLQALVP